METQISTRPYSGKEDVYTVTHLNWHVEARGYVGHGPGKPPTPVERIVVGLHDESWRPQSVPKGVHCAGFAPCLVYMSVEEAEKLQAQLAAAIAERRRADEEAKKKGSSAS